MLDIKKPTKLHSTSLSFGPSMVGLLGVIAGASCLLARHSRLDNSFVFHSVFRDQLFAKVQLFRNTKVHFAENCWNLTQIYHKPRFAKDLFPLKISNLSDSKRLLSTTNV